MQSKEFRVISAVKRMVDSKRIPIRTAHKMLVERAHMSPQTSAKIIRIWVIK